MVAPPFILLPLYIYPTSSAWSALWSTLAAYPTTEVKVIVNVNSGPGDTTYPPSDYVSAIAELNSYSNVNTLCYVHTSWTERAIADVKADIATCAGWASDTAADIHMDGIFFDEAVADYSTTAMAYMTNITNYAKSELGSGKDTVIFNPGMSCDSRYFDIADYIAVFEDSYSDYSLSTVLSGVPTANYGQVAAFIYSFNGADSDGVSIVNNLGASGIGGLFMSTLSGYTAFGTNWAKFCSAMGGSSSSTTSSAAKTTSTTATVVNLAASTTSKVSTLSTVKSSTTSAKATTSSSSAKTASSSTSVKASTSSSTTKTTTSSSSAKATSSSTSAKATTSSSSTKATTSSTSSTSTTSSAALTTSSSSDSGTSQQGSGGLQQNLNNQNRGYQCRRC